jgi:transposase
MTRRPPPRDDPKRTALRAAGALHPHPETVQDALFEAHEFFDRRDRVQVKYEMVRRHRVDGQPVAETARRFGFSRQAFYTAEAVVVAEGLPGLLPRRRGPKGAHKCTEGLLDFIEQRRHEVPGESLARLVALVGERFGVQIHPRSLARAMARRKKNRAGRQAPPA